MLFEALKFSDYLVLAVIVMLIVFSAGINSSIRQSGRHNLKRVEEKLDLILAHLGIEYAPRQDTAWQKLAALQGNKIAAIKAYRDETGVGLAEAKLVVEEYMARVGSE